MKTIVFSVVSLLLFGIIVISDSCTKNEEVSTDIVYPDSGYFGANLLSESQIDVILSNESERIEYSIRAELPENSSLKIVVENVSPMNWALKLSSVNGWAIKKVENPDDSISTLIYNASGPEVCDGSIHFNKNGTNTIEFYENNFSEPSRVKTITY